MVLELVLSLFTGEETEALKGSVTYAKSYGWPGRVGSASRHLAQCPHPLLLNYTASSVAQTNQSGTLQEDAEKVLRDSFLTNSS